MLLGPPQEKLLIRSIHFRSSLVSWTQYKCHLNLKMNHVIYPQYTEGKVAITTAIASNETKVAHGPVRPPVRRSDGLFDGHGGLQDHLIDRVDRRAHNGARSPGAVVHGDDRMILIPKALLP